MRRTPRRHRPRRPTITRQIRRRNRKPLGQKVTKRTPQRPRRVMKHHPQRRTRTPPIQGLHQPRNLNIPLAQQRHNPATNPAPRPRTHQPTGLTSSQTQRLSNHTVCLIDSRRVTIGQRERGAAVDGDREPAWRRNIRATSVARSGSTVRRAARRKMREETRLSAERRPPILGQEIEHLLALTRVILEVPIAKSTLELCKQEHSLTRASASSFQPRCRIGLTTSPDLLRPLALAGAEFRLGRDALIDHGDQFAILLPRMCGCAEPGVNRARLGRGGRSRNASQRGRKCSPAPSAPR